VGLTNSEGSVNSRRYRKVYLRVWWQVVLLLLGSPFRRIPNENDAAHVYYDIDACGYEGHFIVPSSPLRQSLRNRDSTVSEARVRNRFPGPVTVTKARIQ
jgi:hypothetical protein